jgi:GNAT superfamily N-acetyltransferase
VGSVRYKIEDKNLYFYKLAVLKTFRFYGIGSSLLGELEKAARKKGCARIRLDCVLEKKLDKYYEKFGFQIDKVEPHLDHHDVYMSKML